MKKINLKKVIATIIVGMMALGTVGCGEKGITVSDIQDKGELVVGLSADYPPYEYHALIDGEDVIVGFDVDIAEEIAKDLGVDLVIEDMEFSSLITSVQSGKLDMVISGMSPDEERKQAVDFSDIYYEAEQGFLILGENSEEYKTLADLEGKKVGAQMGSIQAEIAEGIEGAELTLLAGINTLLLELKNGNVDAVIVEIPVANLAAQTNPELAVGAEVIKDDSGNGSAIALPKGSEELTAQVNETIARLIEEGSIDTFVQKAVEQVEYQVQ